MIWVIGGVGAGVLGIAAALVWREVQIGKKLEEKELEVNLYASRAEDYERIAKTFEEHIAAERARADKLAAALREREDECERLRDYQAREERNRRELLNFLTYSGSDEGQVELNAE